MEAGLWYDANNDHELMVKGIEFEEIYALN